MKTVRVCSLGQITTALFDVGGEYRRVCSRAQRAFVANRTCPIQLLGVRFRREAAIRRCAKAAVRGRAYNQANRRASAAGEASGLSERLGVDSVTGIATVRVITMVEDLYAVKSLYVMHAR
jgi:hypothetical protein